MSEPLPSKADRLKLANEFINEIASCGREFFRHKGSVRIAELKLLNDQVYILDEYHQVLVNTHSDGD